MAARRYYYSDSITDFLSRSNNEIVGALTLASQHDVNDETLKSWVEIHSPGELPNGLTVEDIMKGTSMPRNEFLFTNANYLLPYTGAGTGIIRAMEEKPDVTFESHETAHEFVIVFRRKSNQVSDQVSDQVGDQVGDQVRSPKPALTKAQKDIVNFCSVPRSAQDILSRLGLSNHSVNKKRHIQPLVDMGVLEMTNPENPNASNQKYRKVRK